MSDPFTYYAEGVPEKLRFLSLRHQAKLLGWTLFQFRLLKYYLWRGLGPDYTSRKLADLGTVLSRPAVRNVLAMAAVQGLLGAILIVAAVSALQGTPIIWSGLVATLVASLLLLPAGLFLMRRLENLAVAVAVVAILQITFIPTVGCAAAIEPGVGWFVTMSLSGGFAIVTTMGMMRGMLPVTARNLWYGVTGALVAGLVGGIILSTLLYMPPGDVIGILTVLALTFPSILGITRLIVYPFELLKVMALKLVRVEANILVRSHPGLRDEVLFAPALGLAAPLAQVLRDDLTQGLALARQISPNAFQRWCVQRALVDLSCRSPDPVRLLYTLLEEPHLRESGSLWVAVLPGEEVEDAKSVLAVFLAELGGLAANTSISSITQLSGYYLTYPLRDRRTLPIRELARLLYRLLDRELVNAPDFSLRSFRSRYESVSGLPCGAEISHSYATMADFMEWQEIEALAEAPRQMAWAGELAGELRPTVMQTLQGLAEVGAEIELYRTSSSQINRLAALSRAMAGLEVLAGRIPEQIPAPEGTLLTRIVRQWQSLVAQASGALGKQALREMQPRARQDARIEEHRSVIWRRPITPVPNPYQVGRPVFPPLFVGRKDIFDRIGEVWLSKAHPDSIILYGHRRMGKSSILRNLVDYAPVGSLLVVTDLKGEIALIEETHHLLHGLADGVAGAAQEGGLDVAEPDPSHYASTAEAGLALRRLLRRVLARLPQGASLILALDEFEAIDEAVTASRIGHEIYDYFRSLSQQPGLVLVLAGLHTLDEMSRDYQAAFYASYVNIRVSYLTQGAAERLITRPTPDFPLDYHPEVVAQILHETRGQPLLVQRICHELVNHLNHELFDLEREREARLMPEDLDAVLSDHFIEAETRYFDGIWYDQIAGKTEAEAVVEALAEAGGASVEALTATTGLPTASVQTALAYLERRDVVAADVAGRWDLCIPLMRRWLQLM